MSRIPLPTPAATTGPAGPEPGTPPSPNAAHGPSSSATGAWTRSRPSRSRRVGRAQVEDLAVLDLTSAEVRAALGVEEAELTDDDWFRWQQIADDARAA